MRTTNELTQTVRITEIFPFYRADLFAACLLEAGYDPAQVMLARKDEREQGYLYDIEHIEVRYPNYNPDAAYLEIGSGRQGIYDSLPETLFYDADHSKQERDKKEIIQQIKALRKREGAVRSFFKLFESEIDRLYTLLQSEELHYDMSHLYDHFVSVYKPQWKILDRMTRCEALRFLRLIPYLSGIAGHRRAAAQAMSFVMDAQITLEEYSLQPEIRADLGGLGEMILGGDFVLEGAPVQQWVLQIVVSNLSMEQCPEYFVGARKYKILEFLVELLIESNTSTSIIISTDTCYNHFYLDSDHAPHPSYLGVNTYL